ncbi:hypothetical protein IH980_00950 [Patescibacteria group bacterium]|nr:hypothetical protein [Patescibacteria group bacterium]
MSLELVKHFRQAGVPEGGSGAEEDMTASAPFPSQDESPVLPANQGSVQVDRSVARMMGHDIFDWSNGNPVFKGDVSEG